MSEQEIPEDRSPSRRFEGLVAVCVLNWRGWRNTLQCLQSIRQLTYPNYLTVVVDNGSGDESLEMIRAWANAHLQDGAFVEYCRSAALGGGEKSKEEALERHPSNRKLVLITNEENLGFTGGNNTAIHYALGRAQPAEYVFLLNNDAEMEKGCLEQLVQVSQKAGAGIVGAVIKERDTGRIQFAGCVGSFPLVRQFFQPLVAFPPYVPMTEDESWDSFWVSGAGILIRQDVLGAVRESTGHYLDDDLFLYWEEVDFCGQARKLGYRSVVANRALVYHGEASSSGGRYNPIAYYYSNRNRVRVAEHLLPRPIRMLFHAIYISLCLGRIIKNLLRGRRDSARAVFCGLVDGYRGVFGKWKQHDEAMRGYVQG
jgi:GT2 family glycosyltransferase